MMNLCFHERSCLFWWNEAAICTLRTKPSLTWSSWHGMKVTSNHLMLYASIMILQLEILQIKMVKKNSDGSRMVRNFQILGNLAKRGTTWQTAKQQTSKVITGASSVMSFSSASFCDSAWNGTISSHGARMPETGGEFLSEAHAVASQSSHIANGSLDALAFTMMKSYQVGSMILNVTMHAQQSLSLSLCTEELPTALK